MKEIAKPRTTSSILSSKLYFNSFDCTNSPMPRVLSRNLKGLIRVKYRGQRLSSPPFSPKRFTHREAVVALLSRPNLHGTSRGEFNFWEAYRPRDYGRQTNYATLEACVNINYHRESRRGEFSVRSRSRKRAFPSSFQLVPPSRIIRTVKQSFAFVISTSWICKFSLFKYISGKKNPIWMERIVQFVFSFRIFWNRFSDFFIIHFPLGNIFSWKWIKLAEQSVKKKKSLFNNSKFYSETFFKGRFPLKWYSINKKKL